MKQAKLGAVFMVTVMALAGTGVAYAHWFDTVNIQATADMGRLGFGFVEQYTNDAGPHCQNGGELFPNPEGMAQGHYDPDQPEGQDRICGEDLPPYPPAPKNVASTNCEMKFEKYWHDGTLMEHELDAGVYETCYEVIEVTLDNVYPNYAPNLYFYLANAGCVPIDVLGFWLIDDGIPGNGFADGIDEPDTWMFMEKCNMYQINLWDSADSINEPDIELGLFAGDGVDPQIDPCDRDLYGVSFHILQPYPQCTTLNFELKIYGVQWNWPVIPPYTPTEPPLPPIPGYP
jgi:hypothetical protein